MSGIFNPCFSCSYEPYEYDPLTQHLIDEYLKAEMPMPERVYKAWDYVIRSLQQDAPDDGKVLTIRVKTSGSSLVLPDKMKGRYIQTIVINNDALNPMQYLQEGDTIFRTDEGTFTEGNIITLISGDVELVPHARTQAVIDYAIANDIPVPGPSSLMRLNNVVIGIDELGLWNIFDIFYWMVGGGSLAFKTINIVNPAKSGTAEGGLINEVRGIKGNAIDGRINTNFGASDWVAMKGNDASHLMYHYGATGTQANSMIASADNWQNTYIQKAAAVGFSRCNMGAPSTTLRMDLAYGMKVARRSSANQMSVIDDNGTQSSAMSGTSQQLPTWMFIHHSPFGPQYGQQSLGMYAIGSFMTTGMYNDLKAAIMPNIIPGFNVL